MLLAMLLSIDTEYRKAKETQWLSEQPIHHQFLNKVLLSVLAISPRPNRQYTEEEMEQFLQPSYKNKFFKNKDEKRRGKSELDPQI